MGLNKYCSGNDYLKTSRFIQAYFLLISDIVQLVLLIVTFQLEAKSPDEESEFDSKNLYIILPVSIINLAFDIFYIVSLHEIKYVGCFCGYTNAKVCRGLKIGLLSLAYCQLIADIVLLLLKLVLYGLNANLTDVESNEDSDNILLYYIIYILLSESKVNLAFNLVYIVGLHKIITVSEENYDLSYKDLKIVCFILAYLQLIVDIVLPVFMIYVVSYQPENIYIICDYIYIILTLVFNIVFIIGLHKKYWTCVLTYLIFSLVAIVYSCIVFIKELGKEATPSVIISFLSILVTQFYLLAIIRNYHQKMKVSEIQQHEIELLRNSMKYEAVYLNSFKDGIL